MSKASEARRNALYQRVLGEGRVRVGELARQLDVTTETIRKDLKVLEERGVLTKKHGSAVVRNAYYQLPFDVKLQEHTLEKQLIARKALEFIEDDAIVYMDPGSTCLQLAKLLRLKKNITVLTNSLPIADIICDSGLDLIMTGGKLQKKGRALVGYYATNVIDTVRIDIAFMGCDGFMDMDGPMTFSMEHAEVNRHILAHSRKNIPLCDSSKFTKTATYQFAKFSDYDVMITNELQEGQQDCVSEVKQLIMVKEN